MRFPYFSEKTLLTLPTGLVSHATDRVLWGYRVRKLDEDERKIALNWLEAVDTELKTIETAAKSHPLDHALTLREDRTIGWNIDRRYGDLRNLVRVLE